MGLTCLLIVQLDRFRVTAIHRSRRRPLLAPHLSLCYTRFVSLVLCGGAVSAQLPEGPRGAIAGSTRFPIGRRVGGLPKGGTEDEA